LLELQGLREDKRVPGCNKKLMLIQPTSTGHLESTIIGRESEVAKIVGVSTEIVMQRVRVLSRRKQIGRTGIVFSVDLAEDEVFEEVLERAAMSNPIVRRRLRKR
jgi:predicted nucleotidyltransferase